MQHPTSNILNSRREHWVPTLTRPATRMLIDTLPEHLSVLESRRDDHLGISLEGEEVEDLSTGNQLSGGIGWGLDEGLSRNVVPPKWMVYNGKCH